MKRKTSLCKKIKTLSKEVFTNPKPMEDEWMVKYNELSSLRLDLETVKSRIRNINKARHATIEIVINKQ